MMDETDIKIEVQNLARKWQYAACKEEDAAVTMLDEPNCNYMEFIVRLKLARQKMQLRKELDNIIKS